MNPTRKALKSVLDAALASNDLDPATGVFYRIAPAGTEFPYVVYHKATGSYLHSFGTDIQREVWLVKGVSDSASGAEDVDAACLELLNKSKFAIAGRNNYGMLRVLDVSYPQEEDGETYHHEGGEYRLFSETS